MAKLSLKELNSLKTPISRKGFRDKATPVKIRIGTIDAGEAKPKISKQTGSLGWGLVRKIYLTVGGKPQECQVGINITIIGSKSAPETTHEDDEPPEIAVQ